MCNSYKSVSWKCQCLLGHALNIIEQMCREPFIHSAASNEWGIMLPFYIFKSSVKICLKRRESVKCTLLPFMFKDSGFFSPVSKINYTGNKDLTIQSRVVQNMEIHSEYCLFAFDQIYHCLSSDRIFQKEQFLSSSLSISKGCVIFALRAPSISVCFNSIAFKRA